VFTFKVTYKRHGYTWEEARELVEIHPFKHDEYPRFLPIAWPYYFNVFSMMASFVLVSVVFLGHIDKKIKIKSS
jgi:oligosaccharyltransferase complex subunit beta